MEGTFSGGLAITMVDDAFRNVGYNLTHKLKQNSIHFSRESPMSLRTIKLPRQALWPVQTGQSQVNLVELSIRLGQQLLPADPLMVIGEIVDEEIETWPITCPFAGTVTRVFVRVGANLTEATPLCEIDTEAVPDKRLISMTTNSSVMGRSTALVDVVLNIADQVKQNPACE